MNEKLEKIVRYAPFFAKGIFDYHVTRRMRPLKPVAMSLSATMWCDSKCQICNIWQLRPKGELKAPQFDKVFSSDLFSDIRFLHIGGGEPTLKPDLVEMFEVVLRRFPKLQKGNITTNSFRPRIVVEKIAKMLEMAEARGVDWGVRLSMDGYGEIHDKVRGIPGGFQKVLEVIARLRELPQVKARPGIVKLGCTICKTNVDHIEELDAWAKSQGLPIGYALMRFDHYFNNSEDDRNIACDRQDVARLARFFSDRPRQLLDFDRYFFDEMMRMSLADEQRSAPCIFQVDGLVMDSWGSMFYCHPTKKLGNAYERDAAEIYFAPENLAYRDALIDGPCKGCAQSCFGTEVYARELLWLLKQPFRHRPDGLDLAPPEPAR